MSHQASRRRPIVGLTAAVEDSGTGSRDRCGGDRVAREQSASGSTLRGRLRERREWDRHLQRAGAQRAGTGYSVEATSGGLNSAATTPVTVSAAVRRCVWSSPSQPSGSVAARRSFAVGRGPGCVGNLATGFGGTVVVVIAGESPRHSGCERSPLQASGGEATVTDAEPDQDRQGLRGHHHEQRPDSGRHVGLQRDQAGGRGGPAAVRRSYPLPPSKLRTLRGIRPGHSDRRRITPRRGTAGARPRWRTGGRGILRKSLKNYLEAASELGSKMQILRDRCIQKMRS